MNKIFVIAAITAILIGPIVMHDTAKQAYASPSIQLIPDHGTPGQTISYTVSGYTANTQYIISFNGAPVANGFAGDPATTGPVQGTFIVPNMIGPATVTYTGFTTNGETVSAPFTVTSPSETTSVQSSVTIAGTCGIATPGILQYGTLIPGATSGEQILPLQNTGTVSASLFVSGTDWLDSSSVNQINVGNTKWSTTPGPYSGMTALTTDPVMLTGTFDIVPATLQTYWQLQANLNHGTFIGTLTQTVSLSVSC